MIDEVTKNISYPFDDVLGNYPEKEQIILKSAFNMSVSFREDISNSKYHILSPGMLSQFVKILSELNLDCKSLAASFFHDLYSFQEITNRVKSKLGNKILDLVNEYGHVNDISNKTKKGESEEEYIRVVLSVANDFNVVLMLITNKLVLINNSEKLGKDGRKV
ncbi:HD domain-containing protein, partial [candidate division KSB1 bacterium]